MSFLLTYFPLHSEVGRCPKHVITELLLLYGNIVNLCCLHIVWYIITLIIWTYEHTYHCYVICGILCEIQVGSFEESIQSNIGKGKYVVVIVHFISYTMYLEKDTKNGS